MTKELVDRLERITILQSKILTAHCEVEGMRAENFHRAQCGQSIAYGEDAFFGVVEKNGLSYNELVDFLNGPKPSSKIPV
jgi:hypothetical protein